MSDVTVTGNLVSTHGATWAIWRVPTAPYQYLPVRHQRTAHATVQSALTALTEPTIWLSVCRDLTSADVLDRVVADRTRPAWLKLAASTPRQLAETHRRMSEASGDGLLFERRTYLATQLPDDDPGWSGLVAGWVAGSAAAAGAGTQDRLSADEHAQRRRQADRVAASLAGLGVTPATNAEIAWLYRRRWLRDISPPPLHDTDRQPAGPTRPGRIDATVFEGGTSDDPDRPDHRRYLRVDTPLGTAYQTAIAIADTPEAWTFPDGNGEWLAAVDLAPWPVEWALRIQPVANDQARRQAKQHGRQLAGQWDQHDGDPDRDNAHADLARAADAVKGHLAELTATPSAPELLTTTIYSVAAPTLDELEDRAGRLMALFAGCEYVIARPTGDQQPLLEAMLPGRPVRMTGPFAWIGSSHVCSHYRQWLLPRALASAMPTVAGNAGDDHGMLLGLNRDAPGTPILFDPAAGPRSGRSGSMAVFGVLGSGKSYLLKRCAHAVVADGGAVVVLDRTVQGEYARLADVMPGRTRLVTLGPDTDASLDPLVMFDDPAERERYGIGFLTQLTGIRMSTAAGVALGRAVKLVVAAGGRLADVADALADLDTDTDVDDLVASLRYLADEPLARVAFGAFEPLRLDADYIVVSTAGLSLPDRDQLDRRDDLLPEQLVSQALLYLVAAAAKRATFASADRFAVTMLDEAWSLASSPAGRSLLLELLRDGRKHNAAAWLGSQLPADLAADSRLVDLVATVGMFRLAGDAVASGLDVLGLDHDSDLSDMLASADVDAMPTGTCLWRDPAGRTVRVAVAPAATATLETAFDTTPDPRDVTATRPVQVAP